jgi:hypothetical protein
MLVVNEGILLLFIRSADPEIVGWTSGKYTTDFYPLSQLEGVCVAGGGRARSFPTEASRIPTSHPTSYGQDWTHSHDVSIFVLG